MNVATIVLVLKTNMPVIDTPQKLRGYIGNKFIDYPILHHHSDGQNNIFSYPKVQYKIIGGTPIIIGIEEGAEVLRLISGEINELELGDKKYSVEEKQIIEKRQEFGITKTSQQYVFLTPWLALNEKNYLDYNNLNPKEQILRLHKIIIGNILSISKYLEYVVVEQIQVKTKLQPKKVFSKGIPLIGFEGEFQVNFNIPDYFGIGKSVSRGFGTVRKCGEIKET